MIGLYRLRNVAGLLGIILKWFGVVFVVPMLFAVGYGESVVPFLAPLAVAAIVGFGLERTFPETELERADGFLLVVSTWVSVSLIGCLPYLVTGVGSLASPVNAIFESVSGFSCTGSTVINEISVQKYSHSLMLWRQLTQWLGGMGILVLAVAVLPRLSVGGAQFLDNEVPGPKMDRLTPHMAETARRLWLLYVAASALLFVLFVTIHFAGLAPEMTPYQAIAHALTTLPSGGFSPQARSLEAFSPAIQWAILPFMFVAAMNFALLWRAIFNHPGELVRNVEFKVYSWLLVVGGIVAAGMLVLHQQYETVEETIRQGVFQIATILTTTGYASTDFANWPGTVLALLAVLMLISGCVGSTSGGIKILRWVVGVKVIYREALQRIHPSAVRPLRLGDRVLKSSVIRGSLVLIVVYLLLVGLSCVLVTIDVQLAGIEMSFGAVFTSVAVTIGNIGPGFGKIGPMSNFEFLPTFSKFWMCFLMIAGRLEVMSFLVLLVPRYWTD